MWSCLSSLVHRHPHKTNPSTSCAVNSRSPRIHAREVALIGEITGDSDLRETQLRFAQQCFGVLDALAQQPPVWRIACAWLEGSREIADREPTFTCEFGERDVCSQIRHHCLTRTPELPGREGAALVM